ncbi:MAG: protealysin inhibitor emfourin [Chloroflexota bacterium]|nr:protealysin inhibitor emfourin [Chloroflexota bacterium]
MRISLRTDGGFAYFPGLNRPIVIDSETLPNEEQKSLNTLLDQVKFFTLPEVVATPAPGSADIMQYTITIKDGRQRHTVQFVDPIKNEPLQALVEYIQTKALEKSP